MGLAEVIPLYPQTEPERSCFTCEHARFPDTASGAVTWCLVYEEQIHSELYDAEHCFTYSHCPEGDQPNDFVLEEE